MSKKPIFLFLALALPVLIFLFLKKFGRNEFEIPVYYAGKADSLNSVCGTRYKDPYSIPDSVMKGIGHWSGKTTVFVFAGGAGAIEESRLTDTFSKDEFSVWYADKESPPAGITRWKTCAFFVTPETAGHQLRASGFKPVVGKPIVLVDAQKRIRGYYQAHSLDEMDRLIVEMKILLKKY